jgi:hypothetical protein
MISKRMRIAALTAALCGVSAQAPAQECQAVTKVVKDMIDKLDPDKAKDPAPKCAAFGEGLGLMKMFRIVTDECLDEGDKRIQILADLDRSIRRLQTQVDKNCE